MSSSEASDEDIIGFKAQPRYTNIDFREKLALNAEQVRELREWYNGDDAHEYMIEHLQKQY